ncbi:MAG: DEAD/DEAH box helicase family protein [Deltaproteobacteria bacterium]|nr:DEAD/DEAH box helicase family protein [Deltaproteobacteria bacterium]
MTSPNQTPEQAARDKIDGMLSQSGWVVQDKKKIDFSAGLGVAVREYQTDVGPADYVLFVDKKPVGVVEAKPEDWGEKITTVEEQSAAYAAARLKWVNNQEPLPFVYESTGVLTRFTDGRDPKPRSREVFGFPRPETVQDWRAQPASLRKRLQGLPELDPAGLRACQVNAIEKLETSFKDDRPRALIQMATGSGKTYTAITSIYRLLKHADAKRVLFLVDTRNLGEQAEQEFMAHLPGDDNRQFTELYNVQRLRSSYVAGDSQVCISTIQRVASEFNSKLLSFWANTFGQRYFDKAGKQTTNLASINKTVLSQFPVPLIPYAEQEEICTQIDRSMMSLDAQEREIARARGMADLLRQSILKKAFSGQLVAQDPSDEPAGVLLAKIRATRAQAGKNGAAARGDRTRYRTRYRT